MKTLATVSLENYARSARAGVEYLKNVELALQCILKEHPLRPGGASGGGRMVVLAIGSDQGLVGRFNKQVMAHAFDWLEKEGVGEKNLTLLVAGRSLASRIVAAGRDVDTLFNMPGSARMTPMVIGRIIQRISEEMGEARGPGSAQSMSSARLRVFYNRKEGDGFRSESAQLLPVDGKFLHSLGAREWPTRNVPFYRSAPPELLSAFVRELLFIGVYRAVSESLAAEHFMRMTTMQNAERNIDARLEEMNLEYQTRRQAEITEELIDVVTGAEALKSAAQF
jgi:F-type H+-transporting ATPase subunit gamma